MQPNEPADYDQPVAYDKDGNPLYAHPPDNDVTPAPQFVHVSRAAEPVAPQMSAQAKKRHEESAARYPLLNLSNEEYIISEVRRHPIGLVGVILGAALLIASVLLGLALYPSVAQTGSPPAVALLLPAVLVIILIVLGAYIVAWVYLNNKFFLTNESVIQEIQVSLFAHNEQTVSLSNIEDASYTQTGLIQLIFNYGSIRLSTEGDETTYRFQYVSNPKQQIAILNNAVEAFKNGRPITND
ncbi:MAG: hypothetical protein JWN75_334 [Candidatus Saccharibacteria bacterium]|nr:hypothetical protein [Candidatus Saccharibacteria bacterium]